jgi:hypothetical protein
MLFLMDKTTANQYAGVADAALKDPARPALGVVQLSLERDSEVMTLRAVATDSHMLANRAVTFLPGAYDSAKTDNDWLENPILVDAKAWKKVLKDAVAVKTLDDTPIVIDITPETVIVASTGDDMEQILKVRNEYQFPKWRSLYRERVTSAVEGATFPAFDVARLSQMATVCSAKPADRKSHPLQLVMMGTDEPEKAWGRPWLFTSTQGNSMLEVLLMPMRLAS